MWDSNDFETELFVVVNMAYNIFNIFIFIFIKTYGSIYGLIFSGPSHLVEPGWFVFVLLHFLNIFGLPHISVGPAVYNRRAFILGSRLIEMVLLSPFFGIFQGVS